MTDSFTLECALEETGASGLLTRVFAPAARLYEEEKEIAALAKEDIGEDDGYLSTYMQGGAYVLSKARHA